MYGVVHSLHSYRLPVKHLILLHHEKLAWYLKHNPSPFILIAKLRSVFYQSAASESSSFLMILISYGDVPSHISTQDNYNCSAVE